MSALRSTTSPRPRLRTVARRRRRRWPWAGLVLLLMLAALGVYAGLLARDVWAAVSAGRTALDRGMAALSVQDAAALTPMRLALAARSFDDAQRSFAGAQRRLGPWDGLAQRYGGALPGAARQVQAVGPLLDLARDISAAGATLSRG